MKGKLSSGFCKGDSVPRDAAGFSPCPVLQGRASAVYVTGANVPSLWVFLSASPSQDCSRKWDSMPSVSASSHYRVSERCVKDSSIKDYFLAVSKFA